jgi:hypothetical protein
LEKQIKGKDYRTTTQTSMSKRTELQNEKFHFKKELGVEIKSTKNLVTLLML